MSPAIAEQQFRIWVDRTDVGSACITFDGISVEPFANVPLTRVLDGESRIFGVIIGHTFNKVQRTWLRDQWQIPIMGRSLDQFFDEEIAQLGGSFIAIVSLGGERRIYLDSMGNFSLVYDATLRVAGSTASAILDEPEYDALLDRDLRRRLDVEGGGWFPAGLTAHRGIRRLLTNHFLDLESWQEMRHWPLSPIEYSNNTAACIKQIVTDVRTSIEIILESRKSLIMGLTAGADSRMLLAICRPYLDRVRFYTVNTSRSKLDVNIACRLAQKFCLKHLVLPSVTATPMQQDVWDRRVGHAVVTSNRRLHLSVAPLEGQICVGGLGGEVGRCFLWRNGAEVAKITPVLIVDRLKLPRIPEVMQNVTAWLKMAPNVDPLQLLDLAYIELRMNSWANSQSYANTLEKILHPLTSRQVVTTMFSIDPINKINDTLPKNIIYMLWPELLKIPINRHGDSRDKIRPIVRAFYEPKRGLRKILQMTRDAMRLLQR